ncbi:DMT family transporter [Pelagibacterium limicola]|uniref:DMT family transporter n=1 Tax=Pelagibacterium limicola TaxID=2791022 RepID=UPI0018AF7DF1|nr:DMT family transporter [Pelagibacterium limicola]
MRIIVLTAIAMLAFAANSVLARLALAGSAIDAASYTGIRLIAGAALLYPLLTWGPGTGRSRKMGGSWPGAAALFGYAIFFSIAYLMLGAGLGALILFTSVQMSMLGWAVFKGDRPGLIEWVGIGVALASLTYLVSPGLTAPHPFGAVLMALAGASWAVYSVIGRGSKSPLADTTGNFARCVPIAIALTGFGLLTTSVAWEGVAYAVASGAIASGLGYAVWYLALPSLSRVNASTVQLTVPAIAAAGGVLFIGEAITLRLAIASIGILGGVAIALWAAEHRKRAMNP